MAYRFSALDVIVGVGMSAIMFGALLFFVATMGTLDTTATQGVVAEQFSQDPTGLVWLQPALGQAIVDRILLDARVSQRQAEARSQWNSAMLAYHRSQASADAPLGGVMQLAATKPAEHHARVQGVMGHSIVNFTRRGLRSGILSAHRLPSEFNERMIRKTEVMGLQLSEAFESTWQSTLGREVVEAVQRHSRRDAVVQERLGAAITYMTAVEALSVDSRDDNQQQLGALVLAADRANALSDRLQLVASLESFPQETVAPFTRPAAWPEIPMGLMIMAMLGLGTIFFAGMVLSAMAREARIQADRNREMSRWVYRMAG